MSVIYDADPGRLEVYRPRPDGLMGRSFCGSAVIHLLLGLILWTAHFPAPKAPPKRHYRITEVTLLPPSRPSEPAPEEDVTNPEPPGPRDLSLFLNDIAPKSSRRRHRSHRHSQRTHPRPAASRTPMLAREVKPDAPDQGAARSKRAGPQIAQGLPNMLVRPMADRQALDPAAAALPSVDPGGAPPAPAVAPAKPARRVEIPRARPAKPQHVRAAALKAPLTEPSVPAETAPKPVMVARAEPHASMIDPTPARPDQSGLSGPAPVAALPADKPKDEPAERPVELPAGRAGAGKRMAQLPGDLFGSGSAMGPSPSHRDASVPEGRPGAASVPGPRHPRMSRAHADAASTVGGDSAGISPMSAPSGVHLPEEDRPGQHRGGEPSGIGKLGGKGMPMASLPSTDSEARGSGSGATSAGSGAGGGYGSEAPRAFGGGDRPGRSATHSRKTPSFDGDGSGGKSSSTETGIGIPTGGLGGGGAAPESGSGGHGAGSEAGGRGKPGKQIARADLPGDVPGGGEAGDSSSGPHRSGGGDTNSGPRSFSTGGKRRIKTGGADGDGDGEGDGKGKGRDGGSGDGDGKGVGLPGGDGGGDDGPGRDGGDGDSGSSFKGRHEPTGVYVDTTGKFTLPGAIYDGDYRYNSQALRRIMDELNSRTKVKVQLGGQYQSIAPGSFRNAPVVVFTGHKQFELTDEQRKVLKEYVDKGGMIWADLSHAAFDDSFRGEMEKIFGRPPTRLSSSHPIYKSFYVLHGPPPSDLGSADPFEGISVGDRLGVIITPNRYFSTVTRGLNASEEAQEAATQAVVNIYMYAAANYKAVKENGE
jgi:hypothetical protein